MASHDEKQLLDLLQVYKSDDTKKARRNLSTLGFIVIAACFLGIRLSDIKVFGADISHTSEPYVLGLGLALDLYWSVIFYLSYNLDVEIQKERSRLLENALSGIEFRLENLEVQAKQNMGSFSHGEIADLKKAIDSYLLQKARTSKAEQYIGIVSATELWVPVGLAICAATILYVGIIFA